MNTRQVNTLNTMSLELLRHIVSYLDERDIQAFSGVCKYFNDVIKNPEIFRAPTIKEAQLYPKKMIALIQLNNKYNEKLKKAHEEHLKTINELNSEYSTEQKTIKNELHPAIKIKREEIKECLIAYTNKLRHYIDQVNSLIPHDNKNIR